MGSAARVYEWISVNPHSTVGVWMHGYSTNEVVAFSITCRLRSNVPPATVDVKARMELGQVGPHVDGTVGRTIWVTNEAVGPQPFIDIFLDRFRESY